MNSIEQMENCELLQYAFTFCGRNHGGRTSCTDPPSRWRSFFNHPTTLSSDLVNELNCLVGSKNRGRYPEVLKLEVIKTPKAKRVVNTQRQRLVEQPYAQKIASTERVVNTQKATGRKTG